MFSTFFSKQAFFFFLYFTTQYQILYINRQKIFSLLCTGHIMAIFFFLQQGTFSISTILEYLKNSFTRFARQKNLTKIQKRCPALPFELKDTVFVRSPMFLHFMSDLSTQCRLLAISVNRSVSTSPLSFFSLSQPALCSVGGASGEASAPQLPLTGAFWVEEGVRSCFYCWTFTIILCVTSLIIYQSY